MASQSWSEFFDEVRRYIKSEPVKSQLTVSEKFRKFLLKHFTHSVNTLEGGQSFLEHTRREVYVTEGNFAYRQSQLMRHAIENSIDILIEPIQGLHKLEDAEIVGQETLSAVLDYLENLPEALFDFSPDSNKTISKIKNDARFSQAEKNQKANRESAIKKLFIRTACRNYIVERIIANRIDSDFADSYAEFKETKSSKALTVLLNAIEARYPLIAWEGADSDLIKRPFRKAIEELLKRKLRWELSNPLDKYVHHYIPVDSDYFNRIVISPLFLAKIIATDSQRLFKRFVSASQPEVASRFNTFILDAHPADAEIKASEGVKRSLTHSPVFYPRGLLHEECAVPVILRRGSVAPSQVESLVRRPTVRSDYSLAHLATFPTFGNMIGFNVLNPFYLLAAVGQVVFGNIAKLLCYMVGRSFGLLGFDPNSKPAQTIKVIVAGILTLAIPLRLLTFSIAKLSDKVASGFIAGARYLFCRQENTIEVVMQAYHVSSGLPDQSKMPSAMSSPRHSPRQTVPQNQPQTHALIRQQILQAEPNVMHLSPSRSAKADVSGSSVSLPPAMNLVADVKSSPASNAPASVALEEKSHYLAHQHLKAHALNLPNAISPSVMVLHSRMRNRFTFAAPNEESPSSAVSFAHESPQFEIPVLAINRPSLMHASGGSLWEGDFPGTIVVSSCIVPDGESSLVRDTIPMQP